MDIKKVTATGGIEIEYEYDLDGNLIKTTRKGTDSMSESTDDYVWEFDYGFTGPDPTVDFSQYDNDGDGFVDFTAILHSGPDMAATGDPCHLRTMTTKTAMAA